MTKSILQDAIDAWPEDEAYEIGCSVKENMESEHDPDYWQREINRSCEHMRKVFSGETDSLELYFRFRSRLAEILPNFKIPE